MIVNVMEASNGETMGGGEEGVGGWAMKRQALVMVHKKIDKFCNPLWSVS